MPPANRHVDRVFRGALPAPEFSRDLRWARAQATAPAALCGRASSLEARNRFPLAPLPDTRSPHRSPVHSPHLLEGASYRTSAAADFHLRTSRALGLISAALGSKDKSPQLAELFIQYIQYFRRNKCNR
ncbi:hypothetical protein GW7_16531 [Heterocephalus glaber]|uniref:Uncharacterized protein n=1 Tax=Heterocephalus glaber TaxID=10181 RepID=G5B028_HETGA|nr:hypothetical protein GW7_16531 [Heterocephalus glaber]